MSGYEVPAGTFFLNAIQNIVQLEKNFKDADQFKPERFVRGDPDEGRIVFNVLLHQLFPAWPGVDKFCLTWPAKNSA